MADDIKVLDLARIKAIGERFIDRKALAKGQAPDAAGTLALTLVELCDYVGSVEEGVKRILEGAGKTIMALRADVDALKGGAPESAAGKPAPAAAGPAPSAPEGVEADSGGEMTPEQEAAAVAYVMGGLPGNESRGVDPAVAAAALGKKA